MGIAGTYVATKKQMATSIGFLEKVAETVVTGGPVSSISFTGLDINTDGDWYLISMNIQAEASGALSLTMEINNDTTVNHYFRERCSFEAAAVSASRVNDNYVGGLAASETSCFYVNLWHDQSGYPRALIDGTYGAFATTCRDISAWILNATQANITRIDLVGSAARISNGSKIVIYRVRQS